MADELEALEKGKNSIYEANDHLHRESMRLLMTRIKRRNRAIADIFHKRWRNEISGLQACRAASMQMVPASQIRKVSRDVGAMNELSGEMKEHMTLHLEYMRKVCKVRDMHRKDQNAGEAWQLRDLVALNAGHRFQWEGTVYTLIPD